MTYKFTPPNLAFKPSDDLPQHLAHKPVYALPYEAFDCCYAGKGNTDMRFISVGIAQYDPYEVSIKTMRHVGSKWTRQAEELPLHRVVDMALYLAKVLFESANGTVNLPRGTLFNQTSDIEITREPRSQGEMTSYNTAVNQHLPELKERYNQLLECLKDLKEKKQF